MNPRDLGKLSDLFGQDLTGWQIAPCYFLELDHTLMGSFPAITTDKKEIIFTLNKALLEKVWRAIEPRPARVTSFTALVHPESRIAFSLEDIFDRADTLSKRLMSDKTIEALSKTKGAFRWTSGLLQLKELPVHDPVFA